MSTSAWVIFRRRLTHLVYRILNRLRFFPLTLVYLLFDAARKVVNLRQQTGMVKVGDASEQASLAPAAVMLWLDRSRGEPPAGRYDLCLLLPKASTEPNLHDLFSVLLASPHPRSIGLYWDADELRDDIPLLRGRRDSEVHFEQLGNPGGSEIEQFLNNQDRSVALPVAAVRDAHMLLKRYANAASVVCVNLPRNSGVALETLARERPDLWFLDLSSDASGSAPAGNYLSLARGGFTLHERMALVHAADAYLGVFDELGCVAVASRRLVAFCGSRMADSAMPEGNAAWLEKLGERGALTEAMREFLVSHLPPESRVAR